MSGDKVFDLYQKATECSFANWRREFYKALEAHDLQRYEWWMQDTKPLLDRIEAAAKEMEISE